VKDAKKGSKGFLVVISGPSGVGKSTVVKQLMKINKNLVLSVSSTTRPARPIEKNGSDYHFISKDDFFKSVEGGEFIEWAQVHGYYYGTSRDFLLKNLEGKSVVVLEVDVQGAQHIRECCSKGKLKGHNCVFVFLIPPSVDILAFRLKRRKTETTKEMNFRLRAAIAELQVMEKYDYIVVNDEITAAAEKISAIINVEKERVLLN